MHQKLEQKDNWESVLITYLSMTRGGKKWLWLPLYYKRLIFYSITLYSSCPFSLRGKRLLSWGALARLFIVTWSSCLVETYSKHGAVCGQEIIQGQGNKETGLVKKDSALERHSDVKWYIQRCYISFVAIRLRQFLLYLFLTRNCGEVTCTI